jgi:hypothetical protein
VRTGECTVNAVSVLVVDVSCGSAVSVLVCCYNTVSVLSMQCLWLMYIMVVK